MNYVPIVDVQGKPSWNVSAREHLYKPTAVCLSNAYPIYSITREQLERAPEDLQDFTGVKPLNSHDKQRCLLFRVSISRQCLCRASVMHA